MRQMTKDQLTALLTDHKSPCISIYMPTHRFRPDNGQDPIRYRNILRDAENSLSQMYPKQELRTLLEKFEALASDELFWKHRTDGLAILGSPDKFQIFELQTTVNELQVVADSFHIKPLIRALQSSNRYQVLGVNRHEVKLFEGNRDALDEVELADGVPRTLEDALGSELTEPHVTVASYGKGVGGGATAMHHGQGQKKDEVESDNERFFRAIDRAILEHHSRPSALPLILAALPEHHDLFHKVSQNPFLISEGVKLDPQSVSADRFRAEVWRVMEPRQQKQLQELVAKFEEAHSKQLGSADLGAVAQAVIAGRVGTLLVEANRLIPGKLDANSGKIEFGTLDQPGNDDLLDDIAELALARGGDVLVVQSEQMPTTSGIAAIYRF